MSETTWLNQLRFVIIKQLKNVEAGNMKQQTHDEV
jgi:hypothetical protein